MPDSADHNHPLDLSNTGAALDSLGRSLVSRSSLDAAKVRQEARVGSTSEIARVGKSVDSASAANVLLASSSSGAVVDGEQAAAGGGVLDGRLDAGESVSLGEDLGAGGDLEGVAGVVLPVVVDSVQQGVASDLRGAAGRAVDVVAFESDLILCAAFELVMYSTCPINRCNIPSEVQCPVLVAITCCRIVAGAVDLTVGNRNTAGGDLAEDYATVSSSVPFEHH